MNKTIKSQASLKISNNNHNNNSNNNNNNNNSNNNNATATMNPNGNSHVWLHFMWIWSHSKKTKKGLISSLEIRSDKQNNHLSGLKRRATDTDYAGHSPSFKESFTCVFFFF
ncbi:hypothetical protein RFI_06709 [Reticulomyxa filosa]|uniref:Uncharacterized protein n=1 Tax=Reticulomyxa filosa TaxID=46433 RepID=X6NWS2_RETFI|nr:hypothetical protein RFI_06709 [Reticulomyxa filosa]|eukprot:ETO30411.1 hypothetical protein RFI_06709 [Reticulomyxa filosa]